MTPFLDIRDLCKQFDGIRALDGFHMTVDQNEIVGLIGPNGAGKTTLFNVLSGFLKADGGAIRLRGRAILGKAPHALRDLGLARTFQDLRLIRQMSLLENVMLAFPDQRGEALCRLFAQPKRVTLQEKSLKQKAEALLAFAGLEEKAHHPAEMLSYGQQKLLALVCALAAKPALLLLDEPVAGISPAMIEKILAIVKGLPEKGTTVLLIEHDMEAIFSVCDRVIFMDQGRLMSQGSPEAVRNDPQVIEAYLD